MNQLNSLERKAATASAAPAAGAGAGAGVQHPAPGGGAPPLAQHAPLAPGQAVPHQSERVQLAAPGTLQPAQQVPQTTGGTKGSECWATGLACRESRRMLAVLLTCSVVAACLLKRGGISACAS